MKLNKFLLSLLFVPALTFTSCGDYEDVEVDSPQADANALGVNFSAAKASIVKNPTVDKIGFTLNRVNTKEAITVPVTVVSCDKVASGASFCEQPTAFLFAAGEATSTIELKISPECQFQESYSISLSIGSGKDHIYAAGTSATTITYTKDYTWKELAKPIFTETGWFGSATLASIECAKDYTDGAKRYLCNVKGLYSAISMPADVPLKEGEKADAYTPASAEDILFYLDADFKPAGMFTIEGYNSTEINTGILQNEKTGVYYLVKITNIAKDDKSNYVFTYDIIYKVGEVVHTKAANVTASAEVDLKTPIEQLFP